ALLPDQLDLPATTAHGGAERVGAPARTVLRDGERDEPVAARDRREPFALLRAAPERREAEPAGDRREDAERRRRTPELLHEGPEVGEGRPAPPVALREPVPEPAEPRDGLPERGIVPSRRVVPRAPPLARDLAREEASSRFLHRLLGVAGA